ncbi:MAG: LarC family nickel insertion protein, partial [Clostridia bacterium]|nr:LarC family nickel insertion protein [Clostridia bacterium]
GEFSSLILFWLAAWAKPRPENLSFKIKALAWGKLKKELVLPVAWGTTFSEAITVLETAVDDQEPQSWGYLVPKLLQEGAIDVYLTAMQMKKNRPGQLLTVLVRENQVDKIAALILRETTTLGLRVREERRIVLSRSFVELDTPWGKIRIKKSWTSFGVKWQPEYEDCRKIAEEQNWPLLQVYREIDRLTAQKSEFWE